MDIPICLFYAETAYMVYAMLGLLSPQTPLPSQLDYRRGGGEGPAAAGAILRCVENNNINIVPGKRSPSTWIRGQYWAIPNAELIVHPPETRPGRWREAGPVHPVTIKKLK